WRSWPHAASSTRLRCYHRKDRAAVNNSPAAAGGPMTFIVPTLTGHSVRLEPLAAPHRDGLRAAADDERIWRHTLTAAHGHAFEALGVNRVTFVTDLRNERSQAAIAKLGAVREGVLRCHMVTQGGRLRDSVVFSIVAAEWPGVRDRLTARLAALPPA